MIYKGIFRLIKIKAHREYGICDGHDYAMHVNYMHINLFKHGFAQQASQLYSWVQEGIARFTR